jgi:antitoxin component HigA of HigAB toxin-antitoxin module
MERSSVIKTESEYRAILSRVSMLMDMEVQPNTRERDELDLLVLLVMAYEEEHYPVPTPTLWEMVKFEVQDRRGVPVRLRLRNFLSFTLERAAAFVSPYDTL